MGIVIDTSAIVELERTRSSWDAIVERAGEQPVFLPAIVWGELLSGVHLADSVPRALKRREKLDDLRDGVSVLPFTAEVAEVWAELFAALKRTGTPIPANDLSVAATALAHQYQVLVGSRDEEHYRRVPGLTVMSL